MPKKSQPMSEREQADFTLAFARCRGGGGGRLCSSSPFESSSPAYGPTTTTCRRASLPRYTTQCQPVLYFGSDTEQQSAKHVYAKTQGQNSFNLFWPLSLKAPTTNRVQTCYYTGARERVLPVIRRFFFRGINPKPHSPQTFLFFSFCCC